MASNEDYECRPCIVYYTNDSLPRGELFQVSSLFGCKIYRIFGNSWADNVIAATANGLYDLVSQEYVTTIEFVDFSCGVEHCIGINKEGELYSWGEGRFGELGLGPSKVRISDATPISLKSTTIKSIVGGENYTIAVDMTGNAFSWGQNFDKQLGIYRKRLDEMTNKNCIIEDMMYVPRLLPLSIQTPIRKVACGPNFALCVTKSGRVFGWGAGECGQLGTGRCTIREVPTEVSFADKNKVIVDIACGFGHALALDMAGDLYSWGMNKHGQLGMGTTTTVWAPQRVESVVDGRRIRADGNSSAMIDQLGNLYTWGSTIHNRLMHKVEDIGDVTFLSTPLNVASLIGSNIYDIAFAKKSSAILVHSRIFSTSPTCGPQKSLSQLLVSGGGFYESENIIIKLTCKNASAAHNAPRSCLGKFINPCLISCKPPKLIDFGDYAVTVSLDGKEYITDEIIIKVYKEFAILDTSPRILDRRDFIEDDGSVDIKLSMKHISGDIDNLLRGPVLVKFIVTAFQSIASEGEVFEVESEGILVEQTAADSVSVTDNESATSATLESPRGETVEGQRFITSILAIDALGLDSTAVVSIQAQVSLNQQDYCPLSSRHLPVLCHAFNPVSFQPDCCPLITKVSRAIDTNLDTDAVLTIVGSGFFPSVALPRGFEMIAILHMDDQVNLNDAFNIPLRGNSVNELSLRVKDLTRALLSYYRAKNSSHLADDEDYNQGDDSPITALDPANYIPHESFEVKLSFFMKIKVPRSSKASVPNLHNNSMSSLSTHKMEPLGSQVIGLTMYRHCPITVYPSAWRRQSTSIAVEIKSSENPFLFTSPFTRIIIRSANTHSAEDILWTVEGRYEEILQMSIQQSSIIDGGKAASVTAADSTAASSHVTQKKSSLKSPSVAARSSTSIMEPSIEIVTNNDSETLPTESVVIEKPTYKIEFSVPEELISDASRQRVFVELLIDGITSPPIEYQYEVPLYDPIKISSPIAVPKGGAMVGSDVVLDVPALKNIRSSNENQCFIRIRGVTESSVTLPATPDFDRGTVTFVTPESGLLKDVKPEGKKDKKYFLDISVDGGFYFELSATAILSLK